MCLSVTLATVLRVFARWHHNTGIITEMQSFVALFNWLFLTFFIILMFFVIVAEPNICEWASELEKIQSARLVLDSEHIKGIACFLTVQ